MGNTSEEKGHYENFLTNYIPIIKFSETFFCQTFVLYYILLNMKL